MTNSERRPFDTSLQGLAALYSRHFLAWLRGPQAVWLQELNSVIVAQQRRADFLIRYLDEEEQERFLHIEFQTVTQSGDPQIELPVRMVTYAAFALNRYGIVPDQVLVLLKDTAASRRVPNVFAQGRMRVEYDVVRLWELDPAPLVESGLVGLMPLVPLMAGESLEELLEQAAEVVEAGVQSIQERNEVLTVTGLLASLKDARIVEQFMYARSIMSLLTETPLFQMLTQERVLDTRRQSLLMLVEHKFGTQGQEVREAIEAINATEVLDQLLLAASDASSLEAFRLSFPLQN
ncbi:MAG: Rpn family recombination-promoting nuclease/putative transposase [Anaerolineae bacterium]|nr:Rpn family recombination-promoting nuclease/putative transposase [Gloeobacterales cyanobacterium ES-bin-313]